MSINTPINLSELLPTQFVLPNRNNIPDESQRENQEIPVAAPIRQKRSLELSQQQRGSELLSKKVLEGQSLQRSKREADGTVELNSVDDRPRLFTLLPWDGKLPSYPKFEVGSPQWGKNKGAQKARLIQYGYTFAESFLASERTSCPSKGLPRKMNPKEEVEAIIRNDIAPGVTECITRRCEFYRELIERFPDKKDGYIKQFQAEMVANLPGWKTYVTEGAKKAMELIENRLYAVTLNNENRWFDEDAWWAWTEDILPIWWRRRWERYRLPEAVCAVKMGAMQTTYDVKEEMGDAINQAVGKLLRDPNEVEVEDDFVAYTDNNCTPVPDEDEE